MQSISGLSDGSAGDWDKQISTDRELADRLYRKTPAPCRYQASSRKRRWGGETSRSDGAGRETWSDQKNRFSTGTDERPEAHGTMWRYAWYKQSRGPGPWLDGKPSPLYWGGFGPLPLPNPPSHPPLSSKARSRHRNATRGKLSAAQLSAGGCFGWKGGAHHATAGPGGHGKASGRLSLSLFFFPLQAGLVPKSPTGKCLTWVGHWAAS